jgi:hypothetical protein
MIDAILAKIFGTKNEREIKALLPKAAAINTVVARAHRFLLRPNPALHSRSGNREISA